MSDLPLARLLRDNPVVVTGAGAFSAAGDSVAALWKAAVAGRSTATWQDFAGVGKDETFAACAAPAIDGSRRDSNPGRRMDRCVQMAWRASREALHQARLDGAIAPERIGLVVGSSRGAVGRKAEGLAPGNRRGRVSPALAAESPFASVSGALSQFLKFTGPGSMISATCASAAFAIAWAAEQILLGHADAMLAGGTEAPLHPVVLAQLRATGILGTHAEAEQTCRPFDGTRDGTVPGEGSGFLVLESARSADRRGAVPLGKLSGWAIGTHDSGRAGVDEDGLGLVQVMRRALDLGGLRAEEIGYLNAHGTGTVMNDAAEARAVSAVFGERTSSLPCSSTKPVTGHCLGATPALEAILCLESLREQIVPPTANHRQPDPRCALDVVPLKARPARVRAAMSNSLGFWGYHASLLFTRV